LQILKKVSKQSLLTFLLQGGAPALTFITHILLTRTLTKADYGLYVLVFSWVTVLSVVSTLGWDDLLVKSSALNEKGKRQLQGLSFTSMSIALFSALVCWLFFYFNRELDQNALFLMGIGFIGVPLITGVQMFGAIIRGRGKIYESQVAEKLIRPAGVILVVGILWATNAVSIAAIIALSVLIIGFAFLYNLWKSYQLTRTLKKGAFQLSDTIRLGAFFALLNTVSVLNSRVDVLMLGWLSELSSVATYNIAVRLSDFMTFSLVLAYTIYAPRIAQLYKNQKLQSLQRLVTQASRWLSLGSLGVLLIYIFAGQQILQLFGQGYDEGYIALLIIASAQMLSCLTGMSGTFLMMSGLEKFAFYAQLSALLLNMLLNAILIPQYGTLGAAIATAVSIVIWNLIMWLVGLTKGGIDNSILGISTRI